MPRSRKQHGLPQYIGKNYLGPGNLYPNDLPPIGTSDQVAQIHDKEYTELQQSFLNRKDFDKRITESDFRAARSFLNNVAAELRAGNIRESGWNTLGALGLGIKLAVEKLIGRVYPNFEGKNDKGCSDCYAFARRIRGLCGGGRGTYVRFKETSSTIARFEKQSESCEIIRSNS